MKARLHAEWPRLRDRLARAMQQWGADFRDVHAEIEPAAPYAAIPTDLSTFTLAATSLRGEPLDLFIQRKQNTMDQHDLLTLTQPTEPDNIIRLPALPSAARPEWKRRLRVRRTDLWANCDNTRPHLPT